MGYESNLNGFHPNLTTLNSLPHVADRMQRGLPISHPIRSVIGDTELVLFENVMFPSHETYSLSLLAAEIIIPACQQREITIADIGTGSGVNAITIGKELKEHPGLTIVATDIDGPALANAEINLQNNNLDGLINLRKRDILTGLQQEFGKLDAIISSPPWYPVKVYQSIPFKPRTAVDGGKDGITFYRNLLVQAREHLSHHGLIVLRTTRYQWDEIYELAAMHFPQLSKYAVYRIGSKAGPLEGAIPSGLVIANDDGFDVEEGNRAYLEKYDFTQLSIPRLGVRKVESQ